MDYLIALIATVILEIFIYILWKRRATEIRVLWLILAVNLITNPLMNFALFLLNPTYGTAVYYVLFLEIIVILAEFFLYKHLKLPNIQALKMSIILNGFSYMFGSLIFGFLVRVLVKIMYSF